MLKFLRFIYYTLTIFFENYFSFMIPISFNRSTSDLKRNVKKLIHNIRGTIDIDRIESAHYYSVVGNERDKDQSSTGVKLSYRDSGGAMQTKDMVVKFLSL